MKSGETAIEDPALPIPQVLRRSSLGRNLDAADLRRVAEAVRPAAFAAGEVICRQGDAGWSMYIVAEGRVCITLESGVAAPRVLEYIGRGGHFGDMALLTGNVRSATVTAVVDSRLLEIDQEQFHRLLLDVPGFSTNISRELVGRLELEMHRRRRRRAPTVVGLVNSTTRTQGLLPLLAKALAALGESLQVLTDRGEIWPTDGGYLIERVPAAATMAERIDLLRGRIRQVIAHQNRILLEWSQQGMDAELPQLLAPCEEIWWLIDTRFAETSLGNLQTMLASAPHLAQRMHLVWVKQRTERFAPAPAESLTVAAPDFKVTLSDEAGRSSWRQRASVQRLVRYLRGTRIGVALGGGGARGLAHLGALRAFDAAGIHFDLVAGTSSGALMGLAYAGAWRPDDALAELGRALAAPRLFRALPGGPRWFLWSQFHRGAWERMLRPYLRDMRLEQLTLPLYTVAVDLMRGVQVVRERGDAVHAVIESINLPYMARPIMRDGMALVDGGVLNNLPGDVLSERGADYVVGIDVFARLPPEFGGRPRRDGRPPRAPGVLETLLRVSEVQAFGVTALRSGAIDLLIAPDTSAYDFADFSRAEELAEVGQRAAQEALPQLKQGLADLESGPRKT